MQREKLKTHLYVHIPFCHHICPYCSFYKHTPSDLANKAFIQAIGREARLRVKELGELLPVTIYLGGGTPSLLSRSHFSLLISELYNAFDVSCLEEFTMEANPRTFDASKARLYRESGVTRISLGAQSFHAEELKALGRDHEAEEIEESFRLLREQNFASLNIDLMFSIPGQTECSWRETLERALALQPDHISAYNLTYEEDTAYFEKFKQGLYQDEPERNAHLYTLADNMLTAAGFEHYETSNYALRTHRSKHNQAYWQGANYLGLGPSAVSTHECKRWKNIPDTAAYTKLLLNGQTSTSEKEDLDNEAWRIERMALQLRTLEGLPLRYLKNLSDSQRLLEENLAEIKNGHLRLVGKGSLLVDEVVSWLM